MYIKCLVKFIGRDNFVFPGYSLPKSTHLNFANAATALTTQNTHL